jgi:hypothetical protein
MDVDHRLAEHQNLPLERSDEFVDALSGPLQGT